MSPRIANKDRGELPKPQVKPGTLGFSPLNQLSASYQHHRIGDVILGIQQVGTSPVLESTSIALQKDDAKTELLELKGIYFKSLSDALYRGKLPQVLISAPPVESLPALVTEVLDYVEKMLSLGFLLQPNAVEQLLPNVVIVSNGVFFNRLMTSMGHQLQRMPQLPNHFHVPILSKFHRGFLELPVPVVLTLQEPVAVVPPPLKLKIAASNHQWKQERNRNLETIQSVLSLHGMITVLENTVPNAVERLELEHALVRSTEVILPALARAEAMPAKEMSTMADKVHRAILRIGKQLMAFEELELTPGLGAAKTSVTPRGAVSSKASKPSSAAAQNKTVDAPPALAGSAKQKAAVALDGKGALSDQALSSSDLTITDSLCYYAESLGLQEEKALFDNLNRRLLSQLKP